MFEEREKGDVVVSVEGQDIRTYGVLLGLASPVFAALLCEGPERRIQLPGKSKEEFELFLAFLRPCSVHRVNKDNVDILLPWSDDYEVAGLKSKCENVLLTMPVTVSRLLQARKMNLHEQYRRCLTGLPEVDFKTSFETLVKESDVLQELVKEHPSLHMVSDFSRLDCKRCANGMQRFGNCLAKLLAKYTSVEHILPVLVACLSDLDALDEAFYNKLIEMPWSTPEAVQVGSELVLFFLAKERTNRELMEELEEKKRVLRKERTNRELMEQLEEKKRALRNMRPA